MIALLDVKEQIFILGLINFLIMMYRVVPKQNPTHLRISYDCKIKIRLYPNNGIKMKNDFCVYKYSTFTKTNQRELQRYLEACNFNHPAPRTFLLMKNFYYVCMCILKATPSE